MEASEARCGGWGASRHWSVGNGIQGMCCAAQPPISTEWDAFIQSGRHSEWEASIRSGTHPFGVGGSDETVSSRDGE